MTGSVAAEHPAMKATANKKGKYLTVVLEKEEYGRSTIFKVKEIIGI
jgi:hypothetical protein